MRRVIILALCGCGRLHFEALSDGGGDATAGDGVRLDATFMGDVVPPNACGTTVLMTDGFDDGVDLPLFTASQSAGVTVSETGSSVVVTFGASTSAGVYGYYRTTNAYVADGLCAVTEVQGIPVAADAATYMKLRTAAQEVEFFEHAGQLDLRSRMNNNVVTNGTVAWATAETRWLRLRQQGGVTHWDTSGDNVVWNERLAVPGFPTANCQVEIGAGAIQAVTNAGTASFSSVTLTGP